MLRSVHDQLSLDGSHAVLLVLRVHLVPGNHQRIHVVDGSSRSQDAVSMCEPDDLPHLGQASMLHQDEDRCYLIGKHVGVCSRSQPFSSQRNNVQSGRQLIEKPRMSCAKVKVLLRRKELYSF